jgi:hypothetical protein
VAAPAMNKLHSQSHNTITTLGILLLLSIYAHAQEREPNGELRIYHRATQIRTVANREFKDDKGRTVKVIYYDYTGDSSGNIREELLREQSSSTYEYDEYDCAIKSKRYDRLQNLTSVEEVRCMEGKSIPLLTTVRNSSNVKQRETRHTETGSTQTVLQFDSAGEKVIGINGELPGDTDLVHGWGDAVNGFALGIAADRESGSQQDFWVHVTVKNVDNDSWTVMVSPVLVELKKSNGQVIQEKATYTSNPNESGACPTFLQTGAPRAGRAIIQYVFNLAERFDPLPPGKYSMTITYCMSEGSERLISNTIQIEVN